MGLKESMQNDLDLFFDTSEFADTVTYNSETINVIFEIQQDREGNDFSTSGQAAMADVFVKKTDVSAWSRKDKITRDSETWRFRYLAGEDPGVWHFVFGAKETVL